MRRVLADYRTFTSEGGTAISMLDVSDPSAGRMMQATDPPRQASMRRVLGAPLSDQCLRRFGPAVRELVDEVMDSLAEEEICDVAEAFSWLPVAVAGVLMGFPKSDVGELRRLSYRALAPLDPTFSVGSPELTASAGRIGLMLYFDEVVRLRRRTSSDDLVSHMLAAEIDGVQLSHEDVLLNCMSFMLGAVVTTSHAISATMLAIVERHHGEGRWPQHAQPAVLAEEALRWSSPITHFMRRAKAETLIRGAKISEGEAVTAWIASANRDELIFERPYELDAERVPNRHIAFGAGVHRCVGAGLARMVLAESFGSLMRRTECFELAGDVRHLVSNEIAGIVNLPLRFNRLG